MKYKLSISLLLILLVSVLFVFIFEAPSSNPKQNIKTNSKQNESFEVIKEPSQAVSTSKPSQLDGNNEDAMIPNKTDEPESMDQPAMTIEKKRTPENLGSAWQDINSTVELDVLKPESSLIENIKAIEIENISKFRALNQGDSLTLNLPDSSDINVEVEFNEFQNQGIRTWSGNFDVEGQNYPVTFTFGESSVLGFIGHPNGVIRVEGKGSSAWIYEVPTRQPQPHDHSHDLPEGMSH
ncbi:hypothetical protein AB2S62_18665 [Vibrio sp. NTOU-M3]|uniref:hypothetical protein n=1 Tax=Vibrio sp. NTOU-M3 TaxID=3234954 RepID=UPI00349FBCC7